MSPLPWFRTPDDGKENPAERFHYETPSRKNRAAANQKNLYIALMRLAETPIERAVIHAYYSCQPGSLEALAKDWLAQKENLPPVPGLQEALRRAIGNKPDAQEMLSVALERGRVISPHVLAQFPDLQVKSRPVEPEYHFDVYALSGGRIVD